MPECDADVNNREIQYDQPWLHFAVPYSSEKFDSCVRYAPIIRNGTNTFFVETNQCSPAMFNRSETIECSDFVYASNEKNIQTEVRLCSILKSFPKIN